ncbi:Iron-sulfur cluster assembly 1 homolog [Durusdinium trenchii]|uniref:Mitochondrial (Lethal (1) G0136) (Putative magnetoreceptor subunit MagR) n=1 Tax=Durusdinium trenchii TaxID=1381693 RepID=A0ABP0LK41_9DINO
MAEIMANADEDFIGVKIGVKNGGCAGMEYTMDYATEAGPLDEVVEENGIKVLIDPKAILFLIGTEIDYVTEKLSQRVYCDGAIFAITGDEGLWFKVDDVTRAEFEAAALEPFTYEFDNGKKGQMSYYTAPEEVFDDEDALRHWTGLALAAAARSQKMKKKPLRKGRQKEK